MTHRAFIFDMDGTIVDNMAFHTKSWVAFFEQRGHAIDADEFFRNTAGRQGHEIMSHYMGQHLTKEESALLDAEKEALYRELYAPHLETVAGFDQLIEEAQDRWACATC